LERGERLILIKLILLVQYDESFFFLLRICRIERLCNGLSFNSHLVIINYLSSKFLMKTKTKVYESERLPKTHSVFIFRVSDKEDSVKMSRQHEKKINLH